MEGLGDLSQAAVGIAAIIIAVGTFVMSSNDRRHRDDREELRELRSENERLRESRDDYQRRYFQALQDLWRGEAPVVTRNARALLASLVVIAALAMCAPPRASDAAYALSVDEVVSIVCAPQYAWSCETALAVTWRESNWQPHAYNASSGCAGLWQLHPIHGYSLSTTFDPLASTAIAYELYLRSGWAPWRY